LPDEPEEDEPVEIGLAEGEEAEEAGLEAEPEEVEA